MSGIDVRPFLAICGPDGEDVAAIVAFFVGYMNEQLAALRAAIDAQRVNDVELIAHRCAGSSGTYGFAALAAPFATLEQQARGGDLRSAGALEREARAVFATIDTALRDLAARHAQP